MRSTGGQTLAFGIAACALAAVITGARVTSANTMPGLDLGMWKGLHRGLSTVAVVGALALAFKASGALRSWLFGAVALAALPGGMLEAKVAVHAAGVLHAVAASILTSVTAVAALQFGWQPPTPTATAAAVTPALQFGFQPPPLPAPPTQPQLPQLSRAKRLRRRSNCRRSKSRRPRPR